MSSDEKNLDVVTVKSIWEKAPVSDALSLPPEYDHDDRGRVVKIKLEVVGEGKEASTKYTATPVGPQPVFARGLIVDEGAAQHTYRVDLVWRDRGVWRRGVFPLDDVTAARKLVGLSKYGVPVSEVNSRQLMRFLADFISHNADELPRARSIDRMGWTRGGFMLGGTLLDASGEHEQSADDASSWDESRVMFSPPNDGDAQWVRGFRRRGSLEGWKSAVAMIAEHKNAQMALYASFAAPLVSLMRSRCIFLEYASSTSGGKTSVQQVAASIYGTPDGDDRIIRNWMQTMVAIERMASTLQNLPLILNDTKNRDQRLNVSTTLYSLCDGQGKGRGKPQGLGHVYTWRTAIISSGEEKITSLVGGGDGGAHARVISIVDAPFGEKNATLGMKIETMTRALLRHHGHAGLEWLRWLVRLTPDQIETLRDEWEIKRQAYSALLAGASTVGQRFAGDYATLELAAECAHRLGLLPWQYQGTVADLAVGVTEGTGGADVAEEAYQYVLGEVAARFDDLWAPGAQRVPSGGWLGAAGRDDVALITTRLGAILERGGFSLDVVRTWAEKGWINPSSGRHLTRKRTVGKQRPRCYVLIRDVESVGSVADDEPSPPSEDEPCPF